MEESKKYLEIGNFLLILFQIKGRKVLIDLVIDTRSDNKYI
jgi:hypothetical protein